MVETLPFHIFVLTGSLCGLGSAFNMLLLVVIAKYRVLRQGAGLLVAHFLVCDFLMPSANV